MSAQTFAPKVLLRSEETAGEVSAIQVVVPAGWPGPSLHHHDFEEAFYVLDGELTFQLGDELAKAGAGELIFASRGSHHTVANLSKAEARYLLVCTPAGFERYFARVAADQAGVDPLSWALQELPKVVRVGPGIGEKAQR